MDKLKPAYLIVGQDLLKRKTVLNRLNKRLSEYGDIEINKNIFDGSNADPSEIVNCAYTAPFMSKVRYVQIDNADKLSPDKIIEYIQNPSQTTIMTLICNKLAKNTRLYKSMDKTCIINCEAPKKYLLADHLTKLYNIKKDAVQRLIELVGEDTLLLDSQIKKIQLFTNTTITLDDVVNNCDKTSISKPWDFTNAFASKNLKLALDIFDSMEEGSEYILLPMTCTKIKELIGTKVVGRNNLGLNDWQTKNYSIWAQNFSMTTLKSILNIALECDAKMKSTSNSKNTFKTFVIESLRMP